MRVSHVSGKATLRSEIFAANTTHVPAPAPDGVNSIFAMSPNASGIGNFETHAV